MCEYAINRFTNPIPIYKSLTHVTIESTNCLYPFSLTLLLKEISNPDLQFEKKSGNGDCNCVSKPSYNFPLPVAYKWAHIWFVEEAEDKVIDWSINLCSLYIVMIMGFVRVR
jgi:hypothetical protein